MISCDRMKVQMITARVHLVRDYGGKGGGGVRECGSKVADCFFQVDSSTVVVA